MSRTAEKPRRGRPPATPGDSRTIRVGVVVSPRELEQLRAAAERAGVSLSTIIRKRGVRA